MLLQGLGSASMSGLSFQAGYSRGSVLEMLAPNTAPLQAIRLRQLVTRIHRSIIGYHLNTETRILNPKP